MLEAWARQKHLSLGLPFPQAASGEITKAVGAEAERLHLARENKDDAFQPTGENIREALETFSTQEWRELIAEFGEQDLNPLRSYLDLHRDELVSQLGRAKFDAIYGSAVNRGIALHLRAASKSGARMVPVTDPMWAAVFRRWAWELKMAGVHSLSKKRTVDEMGGYRAIAESLSRDGRKVTDKQVATYFERMERIPFDQFDGSEEDYYAMIADTRAYKCYLRSQRAD